MALPLYGLRRFRYGRYFGDGVYPTVSKFFVIRDRVTGQLYRVTTPGGVITLVAVAGITSADTKEDCMTVIDESDGGAIKNSYKTLFIENGAFVVRPYVTSTREAFVWDGGQPYLILIGPTHILHADPVSFN